jgi:adenosylcobinamide kinase / adenosylcobinamide-phosphate guanylyltransferase
MRLLLLGTGAADGWPTPFCTCASCATLRNRGEVRRQTAALLDDRILLDCGPEAPRSAVQAGRTLDGLTTVLLTHHHSDHLHPQLLEWRSWSSVARPLLVAGPPLALERCAPVVEPDDPVELLPLVAGDVLELDGYVVRALAAAHTPGALLYDITSTDGSRLLYATDTGPLPQESVDALRDARLDAALLEQTWGDVTDHGTAHHDLPTFVESVRRLRGAGAVTDDTDVVAIHLGHTNPPEPELSRRLSGCGARAARDHEEVVVTGRGGVL